MTNRPRIQISDVIALILEKYGVTHVFGVSGGASLHLLNSVQKNYNIKLISTHHEQSAAFAADSISRISNSFGVAIATSGPGATNLLTGIAGCFFDSIPALFITGQVSTNRQSGVSGVRQIGFQETNIVEMAKPITKLAVKVNDANQIPDIMKKLLNEAFSGRPGPVLLDIPDDIQREYIEFNIEDFAQDNVEFLENNEAGNAEYLISLIEESNKPLLILGAGIKISRQEELIRNFVKSVGIPAVCTWGCIDVLESTNPYKVGTFGTHGNRLSNEIIQQSDLIISIGSRLDLKATGTPAGNFAPSAKLVMIDIDFSEISKFKDRNVVGIIMDLRSKSFSNLLKRISLANGRKKNWVANISYLRSLLVEKRSSISSGVVEPYRFIEHLSDLAESDSQIFTDTGCAVAWVMQNWKSKLGQTILHDCNNTAMGWALPAGIAGSAFNQDRQNIVIVGDGSFMMSMQEIFTASHLRLPIKIFILNNGGYSMIKQTQDQWFYGDYFSSNAGTDLKFPNFEELASSANINYVKLNSELALDYELKQFLNLPGPGICEVMIASNERVVPQVKFGNPINKMDPDL